jgi:hypothetical protein
MLFKAAGKAPQHETRHELDDEVQPHATAARAQKPPRVLAQHVINDDDDDDDD